MCLTKWIEGLSSRDEQIGSLRQQLQDSQSNHSSSVDGGVLRVGVKRGRFMLSQAPRLECSKCRASFDSELQARGSICSVHPMPARELPNKMVAEVFPGEASNPPRYWPCCKQIDSRVPPPCHHGEHNLQSAV